MIDRILPYRVFSHAFLSVRGFFCFFFNFATFHNFALNCNVWLLCGSSTETFIDPTHGKKYTPARQEIRAHEHRHTMAAQAGHGIHMDDFERRTAWYHRHFRMFGADGTHRQDDCRHDTTQRIMNELLDDCPAIGVQNTSLLDRHGLDSLCSAAAELHEMRHDFPPPVANVQVQLLHAVPVDLTCWKICISDGVYAVWAFTISEASLTLSSYVRKADSHNVKYELASIFGEKIRIAMHMAPICSHWEAHGRVLLVHNIAWTSLRFHANIVKHCMRDRSITKSMVHEVLMPRGGLVSRERKAAENKRHLALQQVSFVVAGSPRVVDMCNSFEAQANSHGVNTLETLKWKESAEILARLVFYEPLSESVLSFGRKQPCHLMRITTGALVKGLSFTRVKKHDWQNWDFTHSMGGIRWCMMLRPHGEEACLENTKTWHEVSHVEMKDGNLCFMTSRSSDARMQGIPPVKQATILADKLLSAVQKRGKPDGGACVLEGNEKSTEWDASGFSYRCPVRMDFDAEYMPDVACSVVIKKGVRCWLGGAAWGLLRSTFDIIMSPLPLEQCFKTSGNNCFYDSDGDFSPEGSTKVQSIHWNIGQIDSLIEQMRADDMDNSVSTYSVPITDIPSPLLYELSTVSEGAFGEYKITGSDMGSHMSYYLFVHFDVLSGVHIGPQAILSDFLPMYRDILIPSREINNFQKKNQLLLSELHRNEEPVTVMLKVKTVTAPHSWLDVKVSKGDKYLWCSSVEMRDSFRLAESAYDMHQRLVWNILNRVHNANVTTHDLKSTMPWNGVQSDQSRRNCLCIGGSMRSSIPAYDAFVKVLCSYDVTIGDSLFCSSGIFHKLPIKSLINLSMVNKKLSHMFKSAIESIFKDITMAVCGRDHSKYMRTSLQRNFVFVKTQAHRNRFKCFDMRSIASQDESCHSPRNEIIHSSSAKHNVMDVWTRQRIAMYRRAEVAVATKTTTQDMVAALVTSTTLPEEIWPDCVKIKVLPLMNSGAEFQPCAGHHLKSAWCPLFWMLGSPFRHPIQETTKPRFISDQCRSMWEPFRQDQSNSVANFTTVATYSIGFLHGLVCSVARAAMQSFPGDAHIDTSDPRIARFENGCVIQHDSGVGYNLADVVCVGTGSTSIHCQSMSTVTLKLWESQDVFGVSKSLEASQSNTPSVHMASYSVDRSCFIKTEHCLPFTHGVKFTRNDDVVWSRQSCVAVLDENDSDMETFCGVCLTCLSHRHDVSPASDLYDMKLLWMHDGHTIAPVMVPLAQFRVLQTQMVMQNSTIPYDQRDAYRPQIVLDVLLEPISGVWVAEVDGEAARCSYKFALVAKEVRLNQFVGPADILWEEVHCIATEDSRKLSGHCGPQRFNLASFRDDPESQATSKMMQYADIVQPLTDSEETQEDDESDTLSDFEVEWNEMGNTVVGDTLPEGLFVTLPEGMHRDNDVAETTEENITTIAPEHTNPAQSRQISPDLFCYEDANEALAGTNMCLETSTYPQQLSHEAGGGPDMPASDEGADVKRRRLD